jgi:peroxiredoxin-like protein
VPALALPIGKTDALHVSEKEGSMQPLPHHYNVTVRASDEGRTEITSRGLNPFTSAAPRQFDGPGTLWSPETLLVGAVADCFVLTFRALATASRLLWTSLVCDAEGTVDRVDGVTRFTAIHLRARLGLPADADPDKANNIIEKAEKACLIGNSLRCAPTIETEITVEAPALAPTA